MPTKILAAVQIVEMKSGSWVTLLGGGGEADRVIGNTQLHDQQTTNQQYGEQLHEQQHNGQKYSDQQHHIQHQHNGQRHAQKRHNQQQSDYYSNATFSITTTQLTMQSTSNSVTSKTTGNGKLQPALPNPKTV